MKALFYIVAAALIAAAFFMGRCSGKPPDVGKDTVTVTYTEVVRDTDTVYKPTPYYVARIRTDTVFLPSTDGGTAEVELPIEQKVYEDSAYRAYVSGFRASLDSIFIYSDKQYIYETKTQYKPPKRFTWGLQAGIGTLYDGRFRFGAYVGVGVSIRLGK